MQSYNFRPFQCTHSRWRAITQRDPASHFAFFYGVNSTKIYCRPTCAARVARRANVVFYDSIAQAQHDGFRACHRCKPDDTTFIGQREEVVTRALALLRIKKDTATIKYGLKELAKEVGVTPSYLCRVFKKTMGVTVGEYITQFEMDVSGGQTDISTPYSDSVGPGDMGIGMGPLSLVATPQSASDMESPVQFPSELASDLADMGAGFSSPATTVGSPLATVETWPASSDSPPFQTSIADESLDMYFDYDEWLWTEGFSFNDWFSASTLLNDGVYGRDLGLISPY